MDLESKKAKEIISIFTKVFGDDEGYIKMFLSKGVEENELYTFEKDNKIVSSMFCMPCNIIIDGFKHKCAYIYAVATLEEYRNQGISSALMKSTLEKLKEEKYEAALLVPAEESLIKFYEKQGFENTFFVDYKERTFFRPRNLVLFGKANLADEQDERNEFNRDAAIYVAYDKKALSYREIENAYFGGESLSFFLDGKKGHAVCIKLGDTVYVQELTFQPEDFVLESICNYFDVHNIKVRIRDDKTGIPFGMVNWLNKKPSYDEDGLTSLSLVMD